MPVLNFSYADVKDPQKFQDYVKAAAVLMEQSQVEVIARGQYKTTKRGNEEKPHVAAVFRYPDMEAVEAFYSSEAYQAIVPLRDEACTMSIQLYEE